MRNKLMIGLAGLVMVIALVGGTAMAVGGSQPTTVALTERSAAISDVITTTTVISETTTTTAELSTTTTGVPATVPVNVTVPQTPTTIRQAAPATTEAPKVTTTTVDPKVALRTWWAGAPSKDWVVFHDNFYAGCKTAAQCNKYMDANNKFAADITGIKSIDKNLYVKAQNNMTLAMKGLAAEYTCNVNGTHGATCDAAAEDAVDGYMALVATLSDAGLPVTVQ